MPSLRTMRHQEHLFARLFEDLTQCRIDNPERPLEIALKRKRRTSLANNGRLNLLAADHPARRILRAGNRALAMANREEFLTRLVRILSADVVDGLVATMDVLEELLVLHDLMQSQGLPPFLNNKVLIVSLNRGGLKGSAWELDDAITGPNPAQCAAGKFDGVKMTCRIYDQDAGSLNTMKACAQAITEANALKMPFFLEPLPVVPRDGKLEIKYEANALSEIVGVATALGDSSRYLWLQIPYCPDFSLVSQSTTVPILIMGSEDADTNKCIEEIKNGISNHHNVRGAMLGRNIIYPVNQDPLTVAATIHDAVHKTSWTHTH